MGGERWRVSQKCAPSSSSLSAHQIQTRRLLHQGGTRQHKQAHAKHAAEGDGPGSERECGGWGVSALPSLANLPRPPSLSFLSPSPTPNTNTHQPSASLREPVTCQKRTCPTRAAIGRDQYRPKTDAANAGASSRVSSVVRRDGRIDADLGGATSVIERWCVAGWGEGSAEWRRERRLGARKRTSGVTGALPCRQQACAGACPSGQCGCTHGACVRSRKSGRASLSRSEWRALFLFAAHHSFALSPTPHSFTPFRVLSPPPRTRVV